MYERPSWAVPKDPQSRRTCLGLHFTPEPGHMEPARPAPAWVHLLGDGPTERGPRIMTSFSELARDARAARMVLSMLTKPDDAVTGRLLGRLGAVKTVGLLDGSGKLPGLGRVDARVWRDRLTTAARPDELAGRLRHAEAAGIGVVIPSDRDWPAALTDLSVREPFVLWTRGAASFLSRPFTDLLTITGSQAATSYGERVAADFATDLAHDWRVVVAGGAYGIECAAHRAALAAGGDTIAVLAGGVDRPYPAGHRDLLDQIAGVGLSARRHRARRPPGTGSSRATGSWPPCRTRPSWSRPGSAPARCTPPGRRTTWVATSVRSPAR